MMVFGVTTDSVPVIVTWLAKDTVSVMTICRFSHIFRIRMPVGALDHGSIPGATHAFLSI